MMRIEEIKRSERKKDRILVKLDSGDLLRITEEELLRFGLRKGMELDGAALEEIRAAAKSTDARVTAANMIGSRALSRSELEKRLVKKGAGESDARAAADWLEEIGAVDDAAYAAAIARDYGRRGYGPARVREELRRRGVDRALWDSAMEQMPESAAVLDALIEKKCRGALQDPKEVKRLCDGLLRRGFSWSEVRSAMSRYTDMGEE